MLRQALAADEARTLFTLSAFFIGFGVGQLLLGPLSDRFGRKRLLIAGLALYIVASIACALATGNSDVAGGASGSEQFGQRGVVDSEHDLGGSAGG
jgi:MFS family permease